MIKKLRTNFIASFRYFDAFSGQYLDGREIGTPKLIKRNEVSLTCNDSSGKVTGFGQEGNLGNMTVRSIQEALLERKYMKQLIRVTMSDLKHIFHPKFDI